jgi:putative endonuclease
MGHQSLLVSLRSAVAGRSSRRSCVGAVDLSRVARGRWGEDLAATHYRRHGFEVIGRNWRCEHGEMDLVVQRGDLIVFCEVKTRRTQAYGSGFWAVNRTKQLRLRRIGSAWLRAHPHRSVQVRFDVAAITGVRIEVREGVL